MPELPEENDPLAIKETIHEEVYIKENETYPFLPAQILVLEQQLRKHIQLTFQHYMQFRYQSITGENSDILKNLLVIYSIIFFIYLYLNFKLLEIKLKNIAKRSNSKKHSCLLFVS